MSPPPSAAGPTWVLLRGLTREARHWGPWPQRLAAALPGARVLTPDLPGNGRRWRETSPLRVEDMVEGLRAELQAAGALAPYHLLAMSLGAMVAIAWADRHPRELAHCVLVNTSVRPFSPPWQRLRPASVPALLRCLAGRADAPRWERTILRLTSRQFAPDGDAARALLQDWVRWRRQCPVSARNAWRQLVAAARFQAPAVRPAVPLRLLAGAGDQLVDPRCSRALAEAWGLPLHVHPAAGHDLPLDAPDWLERQLLGMLDHVGLDDLG
ncbi:alpha-beta hydrolase superfamily lysophospholipase [Sphaerotilus hippei]|uniref:Alpha-beta hydrolase superfamily lysophospholipase n=1 Tax=Sphaerotilus hippei TaxID=744406 RepID=A0A318HAC2_9BURK|nr:alpha/beta hydrolase [Sphaerotilus hippei]PXW99232.1 alpha-beta hydrolase superfamily lysophospholipase [Sphaerotilus hippei]